MPKLTDEVKALEKLTKAEVAKVSAAIDAWFTKHFTGNRISADTDTYNLCHAAKEDLKTIITPTPDTAPDSTATTAKSA